MTDNKQHISELKAVIEKRRMQRSMATRDDPTAAALAQQQPDPVEEGAKAQIEQVGCLCTLIDCGLTSLCDLATLLRRGKTRSRRVWNF